MNEKTDTSMPVTPVLGYHFGVKSYPLVIGENQLIYHQFIVLLDPEQIVVRFTDFHRYIHSSRSRGAKSISDDGNNRFAFVSQFLNYVFFNKEGDYHLKSVTKINRDMIVDFFADYGLRNKNGQPTKGTVDRCAISVIGFLVEVIKQNPNACSMKLSDFTTPEIYKTRRGMSKTRLIPNFDIYYQKRKRPIFRDMPNSVFNIFLSYAAEHYQDIYFLIMKKSSTTGFFYRKMRFLHIYSVTGFPFA